MRRQSVDSSNLASVGYDEDGATLEVEFKNGSIYQYFDVPLSVYQGLLGADSIGAFFSQHIRGVYRYTKV